MKKLAKLILFFSLSFIIIFLVSTSLRLLSIHVDWVRTLPQKPNSFISSINTSARWALSLTLYSSILLGMNYASRKKTFALVTVICLFILPLCFTFGFSWILARWDDVPPINNIEKPLGESGLILSNALNKNETVIVLLNGPSDPMGPRVAAIPDSPLLFQEETLYTQFELPFVPFGDDTPWFLKNIFNDLQLNSEHLQHRLNAGSSGSNFKGIPPFLIYTGTLIFLLGSLGFIQKFSNWPFANLFFGIILFRGILSAETFLNSPETQVVFESFLGNRLPVDLTVPLIFVVLGLLIHFYSILVFAARMRDSYE